ncbi:MAG: zinc ribbon domain-containing protein [Burkholderiaceae bacterium]|nr:zinc ribbon domain-containing protein [Burkholderiaceae bacterium]
MPIYEYTCRDCGHPFETLVRNGTVPACPHCHSQALDKRLSAPAALTSTSAAEAAPMAASPCGACGHPGGPGACHFND